MNHLPLFFLSLFGPWPVEQHAHGSRWRPLRRNRKWKGWQQQQRERGKR